MNTKGIISTKVLVMVVAVAITIGLGMPEAKAVDLVKTQAAFKLSYAQEAVKNFFGAIATTKKLVASEPGLYEGALRLGYLYGITQSYPDSVAAYKKASSLKPEAVEPRLGLMGILGLSLIHI